MHLRLFCAGMLIFEILFDISSVFGFVGKSVICHYSETAYDGSDTGRYSVDDIDTSLCTHLVHPAIQILDIKTTEVKNFTSINLDSNEIKKLSAVNRGNSQLKMLIFLSVQLNDWSADHLTLMANSSHVDSVARNVVSFLQKHKFDGITLDFQIKEEILGFMNLIKAMKKAFLPHSYFFAVLGFPYNSMISSEYDIPSLSRDVDFVIVDAYDFNDIHEEHIIADHHAPLYSRTLNKENYTVDFAVSQWINKGFPPEKIILTISLYGISWTLSSNNTTPPAPVKGPGPPAKYTEQGGLMSYLEICLAVKNQRWQVFQDPKKLMGPYAVSPDRENKIWVGYDDPDMAVVKSEYILSKGLGGAAVDYVDYDDFHNKCGGGRNPMLAAIRKTLKSQWTSSSPETSIPSMFLIVIAFLLLYYFKIQFSNHDLC